MNNLVAILTVGSTGFAILIFVTILYRRDSAMKTLSKRIAYLDRTIDEYNERIRIIDTQAHDYMCSLGADGSKLITEIKNMAMAINCLVDEVGSLIATRDLGALHEAQLLLDGSHQEQLNAAQNYDGTVTQRYILPPNWEQDLEQMIQHAGIEISKASQNAAQSGVPKRKKENSTIFSLFKAGIRLKNRPYRW